MAHFGIVFLLLLSFSHIVIVDGSCCFEPAESIASYHESDSTDEGAGESKSSPCLNCARCNNLLSFPSDAQWVEYSPTFSDCLTYRSPFVLSPDIPGFLRPPIA